MQDREGIKRCIVTKNMAYNLLQHQQQLFYKSVKLDSNINPEGVLAATSADEFRSSKNATILENMLPKSNHFCLKNQAIRGGESYFKRELTVEKVSVPMLSDV